MEVTRLQLALANWSYTLHQSPTVAQANLSTLYPADESDLFPAVLVFLSRFPDLSDQLDTRQNGTREPSLELLDILWI